MGLSVKITLKYYAKSSHPHFYRWETLLLDFVTCFWGGFGHRALALVDHVWVCPYELGS